MLHIDGVHPTNKRNTLIECVSLSFILLRSDVVKPHCTTSEPSEHSIAHMRVIMRKFSVLDTMHIVNKLNRMWVVFLES